MEKNIMEIVIKDYYHANGSVPTKSMLKKLMGYTHITFKQELMNYYYEKIKQFVEKNT